MEPTTVRFDANAAYVPLKEPHLKIFTHDGAMAYPLPGAGRVTIGRAHECDLRIDEASISRQHAALKIDSTVSIEDVGSANGTFVGHARLLPGQPVEIHPGDVIELGTVLIAFHPGAAAGSAISAPRQAPKRASVLPRSASASDRITQVVVADPTMERVYRLVERVAPSELSVLLLGETGCGKEIVARTLHSQSRRANGPFLGVNCAALSESLLESELFGHERGAFTGADRAKPGLLEAAAGGTLFLDEIAEMPPAMQSKLLRVLEERKVLRVGSVEPRPLDVRFVAATHRDPGSEIAAGRFRRDLFYRLSGIAISIPPLRERRGEIAALANAFLAAAARAHGRDAPAISAEVLDCLRAHDWPGNVRELRNVVERAYVLAGDGALRPEHFAVGDAIQRPTSNPPQRPASPPTESSRHDDLSLTDQIAALERKQIIDALERCGGNQSRAAKMLGISRSRLIARLNAFGVPRPRKS